MTYQSVTTWQAEDFEVEVRYGFFSTPHDAAAMARDGIKAIFVDGLGMWADLRDGTRAPVRKDGFIVRRLREASRGAARHRPLTIDDFEQIEMSTEAMRNEPAMRSFGSLAWGVIDGAGMPVSLTN